METESTSLLNKNVNDLTVGDALKINAVILAAMAAIPVSLYVGDVVKRRIRSFRDNRKKSNLTLVEA